MLVWSASSLRASASRSSALAFSCRRLYTSVLRLCSSTRAVLGAAKVLTIRLLFSFSSLCRSLRSAASRQPSLRLGLTNYCSDAAVLHLPDRLQFQHLAVAEARATKLDSMQEDGQLNNLKALYPTCNCIQQGLLAKMHQRLTIQKWLQHCKAVKILA